jgi:hypothetical protein
MSNIHVVAATGAATISSQKLVPCADVCAVTVITSRNKASRCGLLSCCDCV